MGPISLYLVKYKVNTSLKYKVNTSLKPYKISNSAVHENITFLTTDIPLLCGSRCRCIGGRGGGGGEGVGGEEKE